MIKIDENYRIEHNDPNNYTLVYEAEKIATKGKNQGQLITEKEEYYYPSVYHCLKRYIMLKQGEVAETNVISTVEDCIKLTEELFEKLSICKQQ